MIDNFVSGEIGIVDTKGHIEFGAFIAILGSESCSANSIEQISVSPLSLFIEVINKGNRPNIVVRGIVYGSTLVCTMLITIGITKNALGVRIICVESGFDAIILLHFWRTVRRRRGRSPGSGNPPRERAKALSY